MHAAVLSDPAQRGLVGHADQRTDDALGHRDPELRNRAEDLLVDDGGGVDLVAGVVVRRVPRGDDPVLELTRLLLCSGEVISDWRAPSARVTRGYVWVWVKVVAGCYKSHYNMWWGACGVW